MDGRFKEAMEFAKKYNTEIRFYGNCGIAYQVDGSHIYAGSYKSWAALDATDFHSSEWDAVWKSGLFFELVGKTVKPVV